MNISMDTILNKLAKELSLTEQQKHNPQKVREHLVAIRTLCDLILDEEREAEVRSVPLPEPKFTAPVQAPPFSPEPVYLQEDDANGSSLLDF
jgi:hypothetical protein